LIEFVTVNKTPGPGLNKVRNAIVIKTKRPLTLIYPIYQLRQDYVITLNEKIIYVYRRLSIFLKLNPAKINMKAIN